MSMPCRAMPLTFPAGWSNPEIEKSVLFAYDLWHQMTLDGTSWHFRLMPPVLRQIVISRFKEEES